MGETIVADGRGKLGLGPSSHSSTTTGQHAIRHARQPCYEGEDKAGRMIVISGHWRTRPMQARASAQQSRNSVAAVLDRSHSQKGGSLREGTSGEPRE